MGLVERSPKDDARVAGDVESLSCAGTQGELCDRSAKSILNGRSFTRPRGQVDQRLRDRTTPVRFQRHATSRRALRRISIS